MKKTAPFRPLLALGLILVALGVGVSATAADWPQYRGPAGDGKSSETIGDVSTSDLKPLWTVPAPLGFSSLSVADGLAVTLVAREDAAGKLRETVLALDADSGAERWSVALGESDYGHDGGNAGTSDNRGGDGPRSTPAIQDGRVYVYDSHLLLSCLDAATGDLLWRRDVVADFQGRNIKWLNATSPLLDGDRVIVGGGGPGQSFLAFDQRTGETVWKSGDETITHATPHLSDETGQRQVVFFVESGLVAVSAADGQENWRVDFPFSVSTAASPITSGNLVYCSAGYGVGAGLFQLGGGSEPDEVWYKPNELMNHWSTPIVHDGHLYGIFEFKKYGRAPLQCVELATGEIKWSQPGFGPGNCILVGDRLVVLSDAGELVIASATPDAYQESARQQVLSGKCWSTPAFVDGRVYLRSTEQAACVEISAK